VTICNTIQEIPLDGSFLSLSMLLIEYPQVLLVKLKRAAVLKPKP